MAHDDADDFDTVEALLDQAESISAAADVTPQKPSEVLDASRSRSGSRSRSKGRQPVSPRDRQTPANGPSSDGRPPREEPRGSRSGRRRRSHHRRSLSRSRSRGHHRRRTPSRTVKSEVPQLSEEEKRKKAAEEERQRLLEEEERRRKEQEDRRRKEEEEASRDDRTVLVLNVSLKATEREIWKFFSENAGKVRDIQLIRDSRSGKSKGVAYVEFYTPDAVIKSLALSGQTVLGAAGVPIRVQASQAEKNRAARAAKLMAAEAAEGGPVQIYVGGLEDSLNEITEDELRELFGHFGDVTKVEIPKDPYTNKGRGFAFVSFTKAAEAREALTAMNDFEIAGQRIKVGFATDSGSCSLNPPAIVVPPTGPSAPPVILPAPPLGLGGFSAASIQQQIAAARAAAQMMEDPPDTERLDDDGGGFLSGASTRIALMQKLQRQEDGAKGMEVPGAPQFLTGGFANIPAAISTNICLAKLFTVEEAVREGASFFNEVTEDVKSECEKHGPVLMVYVNRTAPDGRVYVKFTTSDTAMKAMQALNGRFFGGHPIEVQFISDSVWSVVCRG